jgi:hypothetical protein
MALRRFTTFTLRVASLLRRGRRGVACWRNAAVTVVIPAAFPRAHWLRWPRGLGPRRLITYVACNTLYGFVLRQFLLPRLARMAEEHERAQDELRQQLGCEPTQRELFEHLGLLPND